MIVGKSVKLKTVLIVNQEGPSPVKDVGMLSSYRPPVHVKHAVRTVKLVQAQLNAQNVQQMHI